MKTHLLLVLLALHLFACARPDATVSDSVPASTTVTATATATAAAGMPPASPPVNPQHSPAPEKTASVPPAKGNVTITGVDIANPLVIRGTARTFENNVVLRARDAGGALIAEGFTTATGEMGQFSPYIGTLWLTRDPGKTITVEALEYSARDGSEQSLVSRALPFALPSVDAKLHFADEGCISVNAFTRRLPKSISLARLMAEVLVAGPTADERRRGAVSSFPEGARVESVILRDGTLTVDFNERLQNVGGSCRAQMIRASVTRTLETLPAVRRVVITAGGSEKLALQP